MQKENKHEKIYSSQSHPLGYISCATLISFIYLIKKDYLEKTFILSMQKLCVHVRDEGAGFFSFFVKAFIS